MTKLLRKTARLIVSLALVLLAMTIPPLGDGAGWPAAFAEDSQTQAQSLSQEDPTLDPSDTAAGETADETQSAAAQTPSEGENLPAADPASEEEESHGAAQADTQNEQDTAPAASSGLPEDDGEAATAESSETEALEADNEIAVSRAPVLTTASAPAMLSAAADSAGKTPPVLQSMIDNAMKSAAGTLSGKLQVVLKKDTTYDGEVTVSGEDYNVAEDFELELTTEDAGEDGLQSDGSSKFTGKLFIKSIAVILKGLNMPGKVEVSGEKGSLDYYGSAGDDTVNVTVSDQASAGIHSGEGDDSVTVYVNNGASADIQTGAGDDTVTAVAEGGSLTIDAGADNDTVSVTVGAEGSACVETGAGDDSVSLDVRPGMNGASVSAGAGDDSVSVKNGGDKSENPAGEISVELGAGVNRATADLSLADAVKKLAVKGSTDSSSSLHLTGTLKTDPDNSEYNPISGTEENMFLTAESGKVLNLTSENVSALTDALANKHTVTLTSKTGDFTYQADQPFTNYVLKVPNGSLKQINISAADAKKLALSAVVIDTDSVALSDNKLTVEALADVQVRGLKLILRARNIEINGTLRADYVLMEATDGTSAHGRSFSDLYSAYNESENFASAAFDAGLDMAAQMINVSNRASIVIGKDAVIYSAGDVILLASVEQSGGMLSLLSGINLVNVKVARASIDIAGKIYAGYDFDTQTVGGDKGSVRADAQIKTSIGYDADGKELNGMPLAVSVVSADAAVNVAQGAEIYAARDIVLRSGSGLKIYTRADSGILSSVAPVALAVSVLSNDAAATVDGILSAGGNIKVSALGDTQATGIADKGEGHQNASGGFFSVSVVLQDVLARLCEHANVTAGGSVTVFSEAKEKVDNRAASAAQSIDKAEEGAFAEVKKLGISLLTDKVLPWLKEKIHEKVNAEAFIKAEKLQKAVSKIAVSDKSVQLDDQAEKHGDITITLNDDMEQAGEDDKARAGAYTDASITIKPHTGYKVKTVFWRGYNAGESSYTTEDITKSALSDGIYTLHFRTQYVTLFVEYEEEDGTPVQDDLFPDNTTPDEDEDLDLQALLDDVQNSTDDDSRSIEDILREADDIELGELRLTAEGGGAVLNYESDPSDRTKSYLKVAVGEKLRLIPNPAENKALKQGGLTASYKVKENDKEVTRTVVINADEKGRYIFEVPADMLLDAGLTVKAAFVDSGSKDAAADTTQTQLTGAVAVVVADNDSNAVIDSGASVTAGGSVTVDSAVKTSISNIADGTAVSKSGSSSGGSSNANYAIKRDESQTYNGFDAAGRQYALVVETSGEGTVAAEAVANVNNAYRFTATPKSGYSVAGATLVYYVDGKRKTEALTADDSGKYTVNLSSITNLDKGSVAQVSFAFAQNGEEVTESGASRITAVIPNPIKISYNGLKQGKGSDETFIEIGKISYKEASTNADGSITGYLFEASPKATYVLDGKLKASWTDLSGVTRSVELKKNSDGLWLLDPAEIPTGALITVSASFKDDLHDFKTTGSITNGTVTLYDKQIKATDRPKISVKADAGYSVDEITVTYTGRDGSSATTRLSLSGHSITQAKDKDNKPIDALYEFTLPDNIYANSAVSVSASFKAKTVGLYTGTDSDSKDVKLSEYQVAIGDKVTVTPGDDKLKAGYKITKITVTDANGKVVAESTDGSFTVPADKNIADNAKLTVKVEMQLKEIEVKSADLTNGKVESQSSRADRGDVVTVKVKPDDNYRIKTGTLKAVVKAKDGTYSSEVFMDRRDDTTYTFVMPSDIADPTKIEISFAGEFIPGQSDNSAYETSLGAGVAVTVANSESLSEAKGAVASSGNLKVKSKAGGSVKTEAKAGYSKTNNGFAGAIAVQIASLDSKALVYNTADVKLDGELKISAAAKPDFSVKADASGNKDTGNVGVGAGIAVAVNGSDSFAAVQDGTRLSGKTEGKNLRAVSITAEQELKDVVSAKAGAAGGTAAVPVAAVDVTGSSATASFGKLGNDALGVGDDSALTGKLAVSAKNASGHSVSADASAAGKGAGIGAAIAASVLSDSAAARLKQSLNANQVTVSTETLSTVNETATASAQGGKKNGGSADAKADGLLNGAAKLAGKNKSSSVSGSKVDHAVTNRQQAETGEGSVGVAGAVAVNVQDSASHSEIMDGVDLHARGLVALSAVNGTVSKVKANAATTNSDIGVGVGAAVNIVTIDNTAYLGDGEIRAAQLKVSATTKESSPNEEKKAAEKVKTYDDLAVELSKMAEEYVSSLIKEMGLDEYGLSEELLGEIIGDVTKELAQTLIDATGLKELLGSGDLSAKYEKALKLLSDARDGLLGLPEKLGEPFMEALGDAYDLSGLSSEELGELKELVVANFKTKFVEQLQVSGKGVLEGVKDGMVDYLKDKGGELFSGLFTGHFKENMGKVFSQAKDELAKAVKKQLKSLVVQSFKETLRTISVPGITAENADAAANAFKEAKNAYTAGNINNILESVSAYVTDTFRTEVFDYEKMITTLSETDFASKISQTLLAAAKKASVTLTNSAVAALTDHYDLKLEAEKDPSGHVIDTQAISGAGTRDVGIAGSVAITVLNANTVATIAESAKAVSVDGEVIVEAKELRSVKNVSSAALDANGNAASNKSADTEANADVANGNNTVSSGHVSVDLGAGATGYIREGDKADNRPKVYIKVKDGYKAPSAAGYSYTNSAGEEVSGTVAVTKSGEEYVLDTNSGNLKDLGSTIDIKFRFIPEEILSALPTPEVLSDTNVPAGAVTVSVVGREAENGVLSAREGDTIELRIAKAEGRKVTVVGYRYLDESGKAHEVEIIAGTDIDANNLTGKEKAYTLKTNSASEYVYTIRAPKGTITDILVQIEAGEEEDADDAETSAKDGTGKSVGVGAAFSMVYGDTRTIAELGKRGSFSAGALSVKAESDHKEDIASAAGSDPLEGEWNADATKDFALDASVALNILDNDIRAIVAPGMHVTVTEGDLSLAAAENAKTETTASAFSVGESTAVGASVALNIADSSVRAEMLSDVTVAGSAEIATGSHSEDVTKAIATAMGGDIGRTMAKIGNAADSLEDGANKVLDGSYIDKLGKSNKKSTNTNKKINQRLNEKKGSEGKDANDNASASSNALRSLGVSTNSEDAGSEGTSEAGDQIAAHTEDSIGSVGGDTGTKVQAAAAVGVTAASHEASAKAASIAAGKDIRITAENTGNFHTMGTGAAMSFARHANSIALGVAVSVNHNTATVSATGDLVSNNKGEISVKSALTQNMDGDFLGKLAAQSLSGSVAGKDSAISLGGAVSVVVSDAASRADVAGGHSISGGKVTIEATDKSKLAVRAGGLSLSKGSSVGMGIASTTIVSDNIVTATVGDGAAITADAFKLNAEKLAVTDDDFKQLIDLRYLVTDSSELNDEQRKQANTGLIDVHKGENDDSYKLEVNLSEEKLLAALDALNFLSSQNTYAEAIAGSVAFGSGKASLAGSFAVAVNNNIIKAALGNNVTLSTLSGSAAVTAANGATTRVIAGSLSAAPAKASVGATVAVLLNHDSAAAETGTGAKITSALDFTHSAEQSGDTQVFTGAMSVAAGVKAGTAAGGAVNVIVNKSAAESRIGSGTTIRTGGSARIDSKTALDLMLISGSANVAAGPSASVAAGGTVNVIVDKALSGTGLGDNVSVTADKALHIGSDVSDQMISGALSASVAVSGSGKSGAGAVNVIVSKSAADTTVGRAVNLSAADGDLAVRANNDAWMLNATLAAAGSAGAAIGGSFNVNVFDRKAAVNMIDGTLNASGNLYVRSGGRDTTVMAALAAAGSVSGAALSGNAAVLAESNSIQTNITEGITALAGKSAVLEAYFSGYTVDAAGSIALSGSSLAVGATALSVVKSNDVETKLAASKIAAFGTEDVKTLSGEETHGVYVGANARETQFLGAAGVAATGGTAINGVVDVLVNNNTVIADASQADLSHYQWKQSKIYLQWHFPGRSTINYQTVAIDWLPIFAERLINGRYDYVQYRGVDGKLHYVDKNDLSFADLRNYSSAVTVKATDDTKQILLAGGVSISGGAGVGAAVVTLVSGKEVRALAHDMTATGDVKVVADNRDDVTMLAVSAGGSGSAAVEIGAAVQVLKSRVSARVGGKVSSVNGGVDITADNNTDLINTAVAVAGGGSAAVTPVAVVSYFTGETDAKLLSDSVVKAKNDVNIKAAAGKDIKLYSAGVAIGGAAGVSGTANVAVTKDHTLAIAEKDSSITSASGALNIETGSDYTLNSDTAAIAFGGSAGVGVNAVVSVIKSSAIAELGGTVNVKSDVNVKSVGKRDVTNIGANLAAGTVGTGVNVMVLVLGEKMSQDAADMMTYGNSDSKSGSKTFDAAALMRNIAQGDKGGSSYYGNDVNGAVLAEDTAGNGRYESRQSVGESKDAKGSFDASSGYRSSDFDSTSYNDSGDTQRGEKLEARDTTDVTNAKKFNTVSYSSAPDDAVIARITETAVIERAANVTVLASQPVTADLFGATAGGGAVGVGVSTAVAILRSNVSASSLGTIKSASGTVSVTAESKSDKNVTDRSDALKKILNNISPADGGIRIVGATLGVGAVGVAVGVGVALTDNLTQATLGGRVDAAANVSVKATQDYGHITAAVGTLSAGAVAVAASAAAAQSEGTVSAVIDADTVINASGDVKLTTVGNQNATAIAGTAGAGAVAVNAGVAVAINRMTQTTAGKKGANISAKNITVKASSDTTADSGLIAVSAGAGSFALSAAVSQANAKLDTYVENATLHATDTVEVFNDVTSTAVPQLASLAIGAGACGGNVLLAFNETVSKARVSGSTVNASQLNVVADLQGTAESKLDAAQMGGIAAGLSVNYADMQADNRAVLENSTVTVNSLLVSTGRGSNDNTSAVAQTASAGMGFATANLNAAIARNKTKSYAVLSGGTVNAGDSVLVRSNDTAKADAGVTGADAGYYSVAGNTVVALNDADTRVSAKLNKLTAGKSAAFEVLHKADTDAAIVTGGGAVLEGTASVGVAYGRSSGIIDVDIAELTAGSFSAVNRPSSTTDAKITNGTYSALAATAMAGAAYSQDVFDTRVKLGNATVSGDLSATTDYSVSSDADVTPHKGGIDAKLMKLQVNLALARNTAYAGADLAVEKGTVEVGGKVNVQTIGTGTANAVVRPVKVEVSGVKVAANIANADMSATQAATIHMNDSTLDVKGNVDVQALSRGAEATSSVGNTGADKSTSISLGDLTVSHAYAKENLTGTAGIIGEEKTVPETYVSGQEWVEGHYEHYYHYGQVVSSYWVNGYYRDIYSTRQRIVVDSALNAANLTVQASMNGNKQSKAEATSNGAKSISFLTLGNLESKSTATDSFNAVLQNVAVNASGTANITAKTNTRSNAYGGAPGGYSLVDGGISNTYGNVGSSEDKQTAKVLIGEAGKLSANELNLLAQNQSSVEARLEQKGGYSVARINSSKQPTETRVDTGIIIGRNAELTANGKMSLLSKSLMSSTSKVDSGSTGLILNIATMQGKNELYEDNNLMIDQGAKLTSGDDMTIQAYSKAAMTAESKYSGSYSVFGDNEVCSNNIAHRNMKVALDNDVTVKSGGKLTMTSDLGTDDEIIAASQEYVSSAIEYSKARANNVIYVNSEINLGAANLSSKNDMTLTAQTGGYLKADSYVDGDKGIKLLASPTATAGNVFGGLASEDLAYTTVCINGGNVNGNRAYLTSTDGAVAVKAKQEKTHLIALAKAYSRGAFGGVDAISLNSINGFNRVEVDNTSFSGKNGTALRANTGESSMIRIEDNSYSRLDGITGYERARAMDNMTLYLLIVTDDLSKVSGGNNFTHIAGGTANRTAVTDCGGPWSVKGYRDDWPALNAMPFCSFCAKENFDIDDLESNIGDINAALSGALAKALAPLNDISRMVNGLDPITKARYGEEDDQVASAVYVLDLSTVLKKDVRLTSDQLSGYRLWTDALTQHDVTLLPNATRLYTNAVGRLEYVSEVLRSGVHKIDVITALTGYAFSHPTVPIGSSGSLEMDTGMLTIPAQADFELYLNELSGAWFMEQLASGFIRRLDADQNAINRFASGAGKLPEGDIVEGATADGELGGWKLYWLVDTPETARDENQTLIFLLVNEETDEIDAFRTSVSMIKAGLQPVDVSVYLFRDSKSDRMGIEKYNVLFFDTAAGEESLVVVMTDVPEEREMDMPMALEIVLRGFDVGADLPAYSLTGHFFAMLDGSDGYASAFDGFYEASLDGDTFESDYTRIEGIRDGHLDVTIKADQAIWPEWSGENTAQDIAGKRFEKLDGLWYPVEEASALSDAA